jgi:hypothetical protein
MDDAIIPQNSEHLKLPNKKLDEDRMNLRAENER